MVRRWMFRRCTGGPYADVLIVGAGPFLVESDGGSGDLAPGTAALSSLSVVRRRDSRKLPAKRYPWG